MWVDADAEDYSEQVSEWEGKQVRKVLVSNARKHSFYDEATYEFQTCQTLYLQT